MHVRKWITVIEIIDFKFMGEEWLANCLSLDLLPLNKIYYFLENKSFQDFT